MASIRKVERKSGTAWQVLWRRKGDNKQNGKTFYTRREARIFAAEVERRTGSSSEFNPSVGHRTLKSIAGDLEPPKTGKAQEVRHYALKRLGQLENYELRHVTKFDIEQALAGKTGSTRNQSIFLLRMIWREAARQGYVGADLTAGLKTSRPKPPRRFLSAADVDKLADVLGDHGDTVRLLAYTGMRVGELAGLRVEDWNPTQQTLRITQAVSWVGGVAHVGDPKTEAGRRLIPVPDHIAPLLRSAAQGRAPEAILWPAPRGGLWSSNNWRRNARWKEVTEREGWPGLRLHDLRHSYASIARAAGIDLYVLSRIMGHSSISITSDLYGGVYDDQIMAAASKLNNLHS